MRLAEHISTERADQADKLISTFVTISHVITMTHPTITGSDLNNIFIIERKSGQQIEE